MNYHTDIVNFHGRLLGRALITEGRLFRKSCFLEGRSLERGVIREWALIMSFAVRHLNVIEVQVSSSTLLGTPRVYINSSFCVYFDDPGSGTKPSLKRCEGIHTIDF